MAYREDKVLDKVSVLVSDNWVGQISNVYDILDLIGRNKRIALFFYLYNCKIANQNAKLQIALDFLKKSCKILSNIFTFVNEIGVSGDLAFVFIALKRDYLKPRVIFVLMSGGGNNASAF